MQIERFIPFHEAAKHMRPRHDAAYAIPIISKLIDFNTTALLSNDILCIELY